MKHRLDGEAARRRFNPFSPLVRWVERFEQRGVYAPGDDNQPLSAWRDFGWWITAWLVTVGMFVVFFAVAT